MQRVRLLLHGSGGYGLGFAALGVSCQCHYEITDANPTTALEWASTLALEF